MTKHTSEPMTCETCGTTCPDPTGYGCPAYTPKPASPRPVSAEDVETVRSFINYVTESFSHFPTIARRKTAAIAVLDRIAGKESRHD